MSYVVLARKWRPKTFDDLIGQDYITQTLKNAISTGKIAHAFIFSGPRGVGKTSTARIVAKAVNCINGPTAKPCSECAFCTEISEGKSMDVMEIDAASHTGVNDVREIIENIKYLPTSGKNKIYIIDEAHMLSQSAFNALLKTLEEPPPHVLFILATTEVHKIPVTILSRCQRYDFKKVSVEKIKDQLASIIKAEGVNIQDETLYLIAQEADGSLRDSLSLMDQLIATFGAEIKHEEALAILGILDRSLVKSTLEAIIKKDPQSCISILNQAIEKGISPKRFAEDLLRMMRYALLIKTCGPDALTDLSDEDKSSTQKLLKDVSIETLELLFNMTLSGAENVQRTFYPQMAIELLLIKLSTLENVVPIQDILANLEKITGETGIAPKNSKTTEKSSETYKSAPEPKKAPVMSESKPEKQSEPSEGKSPETAQHQKSNNSKEGFIEFVKSSKPVIARRLEQASKIVFEDSLIRIECEAHSAQLEYLKSKESQNALDVLVKDYFSNNHNLQIIEVEIEKSEHTKSRSDIKAEKKEKIKNDPLLKEAIDVFGGRVVSIKPNSKE